MDIKKFPNTSQKRTAQDNSDQNNVVEIRPNSSNDNGEASDVALARRAAAGSVKDRVIIVGQVDSVITQQTKNFCKQFCRDNRYRYRCTLYSNWGSSNNNAAFCEWGNASYQWMLHELTNPSRLRKFEGRGKARLIGYLATIATSHPFYERWKDWRLERRVRVPVYIKALGDTAGKIFLLLRDGNELPNIAQRMNQDLEAVKQMAKRIVTELTRRSRLYLLDPPQIHSLTDLGAGRPGVDASQQEVQWDIPEMDFESEQREMQDQVRDAMKKLSAEEQFVLEAMVIDELDTKYVLESLRSLGITIKKGVAPEDTTLQQLYYFKRKTIAKLAQMTQLRV